MLKNPLIQEWEIDPLYEKAVNLWLELYWWTELYDESICARRGGRGFAILNTPTEVRESIKYNNYLTKLVFWEMDAAEIPNETRRFAQDRALDIHYATWPKGEPYSRIR
jgi:hypothetical protein